MLEKIPSPVDLPDPGIKPGSPALQADSLPTEISRKPNEAKQMLSLELSCFVNDPVDIGNLISGSSAFSKSSLNI